MKWLNTNTIHNVLNALMGITGTLTFILLKLGCTETTTSISCTNASVPEWLLPWVVGLGGVVGGIKLVMNLTRDGFGGLIKQQPPVATDMKTVVVTGDKNSLTEVKTVTPGAVVMKVLLALVIVSAYLKIRLVA